MEIRNYEEKDCPLLAELFFQTIHTINARDYTKKQLDAWANGEVDLEAWNRSFQKNETLIAMEEGIVIGFGDLDIEKGYLDHLFVHKDYQGRGVATALCDALEKKRKEGRIYTHASMTARPFFEKRGYQLVKEQEVEIRGVYLKNNVMEKYL